jgi:hypothetical protein
MIAGSQPSQSFSVVDLMAARSACLGGREAGGIEVDHARRANRVRFTSASATLHSLLISKYCYW